MCDTLVINVIRGPARQNVKVILKYMLTLFIEIYVTLVISVISRQDRKEILKDI